MHRPPSARDIALRTLTRWRKDGGPIGPLLNSALKGGQLDTRDRSLAMELTYGVVRNITNLDFVLTKFMRRPEEGIPTDVADILRLAAYQVLYLDRVPARAAVFEAVEQSKAFGKGKSAFVNGLLRALLRAGGDIKYPDRNSDPVPYLTVRHSYPDWLVRRWVTRLGVDEAESLMEAGNRVPPLTLRVNTARTTRAALTEILTGAGVGCVPTMYSPDGLVLSGYPPVEEIPGYADGLFFVQDEAAQLVSLLLSPRAGDVILDACAAPGGKAAHMAALTGGEAVIVASDIAPGKLVRLNDNITRLGADSVRPLVMDSCHPAVKGPFDRIMLDAPCSALGVIRRRPEIKLVRTEGDIARLAYLQARMLGALAPLLKPGGALVFSTCSTEPEEGETVVERFLGSNPGFMLDDPSGYLPLPARDLVTVSGYIRTYPHRHGTDGFFAARVVKR